MTNLIKRQNRRVAVPRAGEAMRLDDRTPEGLFESDTDNRYIIAWDNERGPLAVVLRHQLVSAFTWHVLTHHSMTTGRWWGPFRVRLTSSARWERSVQGPGTVFLIGKTVGISCHYGIEGGSAILFGSLPESSGAVLGAETWVIEARETQFAFCARSRRGKLHYGVAPPETAAARDRSSVVELDPRSVLR